MKKLLPLLFFLWCCSVVQAQFILSEEARFQLNPPAFSDSCLPALSIPGLFPVIDLEPSRLDGDDRGSWFREKVFYDHFVKINDGSRYEFFLDPVFDFRAGSEDKNQLYKNTRGYILNGRIGENFFVRSEFYETQTKLSDYAAAWVDTMKFIPGMIRMKPFGINGFDYGVVFSQIMWQPFKNYGVRLGYDRFHFGKGYRSMILSDASQAYPFLMNTLTHGKWSLNHNIASLHNPDFNNRLNVPLSESGVYQQKWFSFTYLTYSPKSWLNLGLFESVVFMPADSTGISFYPMSMFPLPLARTIAVESKGLHHAMIGFQADATWEEQLIFYTQIVADKIDFSKLKYQQGIQGAIQLGVRLIVPEGGYVFSEFSLATNNVYTSSHAWTSYTSNDQPLAHPTGQQFKEIICGFHWRENLFLLDISFNNIWAGALPVTDNYLRADSYTDVLLTGFYEPINRPDRVMHLGFTVAYFINHVTNFAVFAGMHYRNYHSTLSVTPDNSLTYEIGLRHMIRKQYYDFF